jgi:hypothetical protein
MRVLSIALAGVSLALIALTLVPSAGDYRAYFAAGAFVCAAIVLATIVVGWREQAPAPVARTEVTRPAAAGTVVPAPIIAKPAPPAAPVAAPAADAQVVAFLASLQEKGRLVDFLQDDIASYTDAQVGAAARIVHQGCKAVLREQFRIVPVRNENEGATVTVAAGYAADEYRLVGKLNGQAPFSGTLTHRGWKTESVNLPRMLRPDAEHLPTIAPAEVELR